MEKKDQWLEQFATREGRKPSPQEFFAAKEAGFPLEGEASEEDLAHQWVAAFESEQKRKPSPAEYMEAKKTGFQNSTRSASTKMQEFPSEEIEKPSQANLGNQDPKTLWVQAYEAAHGRRPEPQEFALAKETGFDVDYLPDLTSVESVAEPVVVAPAQVDQTTAPVKKEKKFTLSRKQVFTGTAIGLVLIALGGGYYYFDKESGADLAVDQFSKQIENSKFQQLAESFSDADSKKVNWSAEDAKNFVQYLNEDGKLESELAKLEADPSYIIKDQNGNQLLGLEETEKKLGIFPVYEVKTYPLTITAKTNLESLSLNEQKVEKDKELNLGEFSFAPHSFAAKGKTDAGDLNTDITAELSEAKENHITLSISNVDKNLQASLPSDVHGASDIKLYVNNKEVATELTKKLKLIENQTIDVHAQFKFEENTYTTEKSKIFVKPGQENLTADLQLSSDIQQKMTDAKTAKEEKAKQEEEAKRKLEEDKAAISSFMTSYISAMRDSIRNRSVGFTDYYDTNSDAYKVMYDYVANGGVVRANVDYQTTIEYNVTDVAKEGNDYKVTVRNSFKEVYTNGKSDIVNKNQVFMLRPENGSFKIYSISEY
ncbi:hypothetical protein [Streptococcus sp. NLN76]|uniref:TcaA NTF2-like domain-containing protein n=1 Tax=Streptococcus sp. NLN76 TaxID=2822800 RepID=UPI0018A955D2|nr:hypothetical protein [Streptococcus sp. NLN76]MBF8970141.1 hypothetical protein [Streptococcus sp. NLN76]